MHCFYFYRIAAWVMYKLLGKILDGIEVHRDQIENIKRVSQVVNITIVLYYCSICYKVPYRWKISLRNIFVSFKSATDSLI